MTSPDELAEYRLLTDPAGRRRYEGDEFFIAEGYVSLQRAIDSGHRIRSLLLAESRVARIADLVDELRREGVPVHVVTTERLADVTGFDAHRGVLASFTRRTPLSLAEVLPDARRIVVLDGLNDAENVGAIARAARAMAFDAMILDPRCTDEYSRRSVRVSMGEILFLPVVRDAEWPRALDDLHGAGFETWAMTPGDDARTLWELEPPERLAIVLGAEGPGLSEQVMDTATRRVRIPIAADVDSLNVGHAAAVTMAAVSPLRS